MKNRRDKNVRTSKFVLLLSDFEDYSDEQLTKVANFLYKSFVVFRK
jgi:hypothetical protein